MELSKATERLIELALSEDVGPGDVTTEALISPAARATAVFLAKEPLVLCGTEVVQRVFEQVDSDLTFQFLKHDGEHVAAGEKIGTVAGKFSSILIAERTALNFFQRMSGIATKTAQVTSKLKGLRTQVLDTRKTTPGWRELEKYAVRVGGGKNHRMGLFDLILIKNNHIDALGGNVRLALEKAAKAAAKGLQIEVEVRDERELREAVAGKPDFILLDNLTPAQLKTSVELIATLSPDHKILTEASGGITEENARAYAESGVDFISLGSITHSARAVDISLRFLHES